MPDRKVPVNKCSSSPQSRVPRGVQAICNSPPLSMVLVDFLQLPPRNSQSVQRQPPDLLSILLALTPARHTFSRCRTFLSQNQSLLGSCGCFCREFFFEVRVLTPRPTFPESRWSTLSLASTRRPVWHGWSYQETNLPPSQLLGSPRRKLPNQCQGGIPFAKK